MVFCDPNRNGAKSGIFIFALSTCGHCRAAKRFLTEQGVDYDQVEVDNLPPDQMDAALEEMSQYNPAQTFPTIVVGSRVIVGFLEDDLRQVLRKIKGAG